MSRSFRKHHHIGIAGCSDKKGKQQANRMFRLKERMMLRAEEFEKIPVRVREVLNVWSMPKDGKTYYGKWKNDLTYDRHKWFIKFTRK